MKWKRYKGGYLKKRIIVPAVCTSHINLKYMQLTLMSILTVTDYMCLLVDGGFWIVIEITWNVQMQWKVEKKTKGAQKSVSVLLDVMVWPEKGLEQKGRKARGEDADRGIARMREDRLWGCGRVAFSSCSTAAHRSGVRLTSGDWEWNLIQPLHLCGEYVLSKDTYLHVRLLLNLNWTTRLELKRSLWEMQRPFST